MLRTIMLELLFLQGTASDHLYRRSPHLEWAGIPSFL